MLDYITLTQNESYTVSGQGLSIVIMLASGSINVYTETDTLLATLNTNGESYTAMNTVLKVTATINNTVIVIASFPILL